MTVRFSSPLWRGDAGLGVLVPDISDLPERTALPERLELVMKAFYY